jgi:glyoxylase-like metal-dependent hydrolase (beta-lactamase superfamily II)
VFARRYAELNLTVGLVVGAKRALVVDTRGDREQGAELADAVRRVTRLPLAVLITHAHFDHCFGTEAFRPTLVYAQRGCGPALRDTAEAQRAEWMAYYRRHDRHDIARALAATQVVAPSAPVDGSAALDLGDRAVRLLHPGPGHTDHDLVASLPDAGVLFAGDLVEQGAPPDFTDAHPTSWPAALDGLLALAPTTVVPGHGEPVSPEFVATQRAELAQVARLCAAVSAGDLTDAEAVTGGPYPEQTMRAAVRRARAVIVPRR